MRLLVSGTAYHVAFPASVGRRTLRARPVEVASRYHPGNRQGANFLISIILPAKNEAAALAELLPHLRALQPEAEIIVVNDGSTDDTEALCERHGVQCVSSPYSMGNGAAIKRGARAASGDILVFMDADGQHDPNDIPRLLGKLDEGYDMAVGARDWDGQAGVGRGLANGFYNWLASRITGHRVEDLTSGFRAVRADKFRQFLYLLPNGFSYPTTSTMAFFRSAYGVVYVPIKVAQRDGTTSHIKPLRDGLRFLLIIFKIATLYSPLKLFVPASAVFFALGCLNYARTFLDYGRLTNMSTLLWSAAVIVFLIGLVSEQITALTYRRED
ncbi:glycosyltransferase family 2 protein [Oleiagrimonas citrea]|uniref:Glycosyltransferase family 2 protein n=1 Tax=Oleiagrimonas citrea TaxID=1665687 RepID=A0A846ZMY0_9GAMM|nr:glycosyltransferase family 2 protein [Oleiagrimonas citrea]